MKFYYIVSVFVSLVLVISVVCGKHNERRKKQKDSHHKNIHLLSVKHLGKHLRKHLSQHKSRDYRPETRHHESHLHLKGHHDPTGFKCRRVKFIVNRNLHLKKKNSDALKRRMHMKHTKKLLHKFIIGNKRFRLPKETKLFEDTKGNLVTYIEDCVSSERAEKKNFFGSDKELFIAPAFDEKKIQHQRQLPENSVKHDDTIASFNNDAGDEGILPASEDSLFQTVSDSTELLKENADKEGAQFLNDQHDQREIPPDVASMFQPTTFDNPVPKRAEEGIEMQKFYSPPGFNNIPQFPIAEDMTQVSQQPVNNPVLQHDNQLPLTASDGSYVTSPGRMGQAFTEGIHPARFTGNREEQGVVHSFAEAFRKIGNADEQDVATYTNNGLNAPQTLGEEMKVEKAEANYEDNFEHVYGKSHSIGVGGKGAAYLSAKQQ